MQLVRHCATSARGIPMLVGKRREIGSVERIRTSDHLVPNQVAYLPIHCNLIRTCCNAIQTLLQLNSNNSSSAAGSRGFSV